MDHNYYKERVSAYADFALPPYEQMAVEEHLATCTECRDALAKIQALGAWIQARGILGEGEYWEKQAQKIEQRLGISPTEVTPLVRARSWRGLGWKLSAAAASIALVGILAFYTRDSIWQKTDQPSMMQSPKIREMQKNTLENEVLKESLPVAGVSRDSEVKSDKPELKNQTVSAPESKTAAFREDSNYKQSAPVIIADEVHGIAKDISFSSPVEQVDQLLGIVAGEKTMGDSGVIIGSGKAIRQQSESFATSTSEKVDSPGMPKGQALTYWRSIRDSLERDMEPHDTKENILFLAKRITPKGVASSLVEKKDSTDSRARLLEAYSKIAQLSKDSVEIVAATDYLRTIADDSKSTYQKIARAYLDSLGVK